MVETFVILSVGFRTENISLCTSSVYGCEQILLQLAPPSNQKSERVKRIGNARLGPAMAP